jgi:hypothetical protein
MRWRTVARPVARYTVSGTTPNGLRNSRYSSRTRQRHCSDAARPSLPIEGQADHSLVLILARDRGLSRSGWTAHKDDPSHDRHCRRVNQSQMKPVAHSKRLSRQGRTVPVPRWVSAPRQRACNPDVAAANPASHHTQRFKVTPARFTASTPLSAGPVRSAAMHLPGSSSGDGFPAAARQRCRSPASASAPTRTSRRTT